MKNVLYNFGKLRHTLFFSVILFNNFSVTAQEGVRALTLAEINSASAAKAALTAGTTIDNDIKIKGVRYGISLGFSHTFEKLYDASISPIDSTVILEKTPGTAFMISASVSIPIFSKNSTLTKKQYFIKTVGATDVGDPYLVPYGFSIVAAVNLATFNSAQEGSGLFNQKIDGGLGLGYTFSENIQLALTYEMISVKQPKKFILDLEGKPVVLGDTKLAKFDAADDGYFSNKYIPSVSIKLIYIFKGNSSF